MALTGAQYQSMRLKFRGLLSTPFQFVSEVELDSFMGQLNIDVSGAAAVSATQTANANALLAAHLSSPVYAAAMSDFAEFYATATSALPAIVSTLAPARYRQLKDTFVSALSVAGIRNEAQMMGFIGALVFSGDFSSLFSSEYYFAQANRGLTYGATPRATSGNTSTTVITLSGSSPSVPVPVWFKAENTASIGSGATFSISFDGGVNYSITGLAPTAGNAIALTGAGTNLSATWSAGTGVANNTWKATSASHVDQSGNGLTWGQASAALQPIITAGALGRVGLLFDGVDDFYSSAFNIIAGSMVWMVMRQIAWGSYKTILGNGANINKHMIYQDGASVSPNVSAYNNGLGLTGAPLALGTVGRMVATFNGAGSSHKVGANTQVNGTLGAFVSDAGRSLGCDRFSATPINHSNVEVFAWGEMPAQSYDAADTAAASYWGAVI